jgi:hypothetical protein
VGSVIAVDQTAPARDVLAVAENIVAECLYALVRWSNHWRARESHAMWPAGDVIEGTGILRPGSTGVRIQPLRSFAGALPRWLIRLKDVGGAVC